MQIFPIVQLMSFIGKIFKSDPGSYSYVTPNVFKAQFLMRVIVFDTLDKKADCGIVIFVSFLGCNLSTSQSHLSDR